MLKGRSVLSNIRHALGAAEGHLYTVAPVVRSVFFPETGPPSENWSVETTDPLVDAKIKVTGLISHAPNAQGIAVLVHGLGGCAESEYVIRLTNLLYERGHTVLRLNLRGADRKGASLHHAGLYDDIVLALRDEQVAKFKRKWLVGFSMGGHASLWAAKNHPKELTALLTICAPLDLAKGQIHIDSPWAFPYRRHVLRGLKDAYAAFEERHQGPVSKKEAESIGTLLDWDEKVIAPLFGYKSAQEYYAKESAYLAIPELTTPTQILCAEHDPMVSASSLRPHLISTPKETIVEWLPRGGHVGIGRARESSAIDWLTSH